MRRRHTNADFSTTVRLLLCDIGMVLIVSWLMITVPEHMTAGVVSKMPIYVAPLEVRDTIQLPSSRFCKLTLDSLSIIHVDGRQVTMGAAYKALYSRLYRNIGAREPTCIWLSVSRQANYQSYLDLLDVQAAVLGDLRREIAIGLGVDMDHYYYEGSPFAVRRVIDQELGYCVLEEVSVGFAEFGGGVDWWLLE